MVSGALLPQRAPLVAVVVTRLLWRVLAGAFAFLRAGVRSPRSGRAACALRIADPLNLTRVREVPTHKRINSFFFLTT